MSRLVLVWLLAALLTSCGDGAASDAPGAPGASGTSGASGTARAPGTPRNVILISLDSLRADHVGCYGYARDTSPRMDRLAAQGALCERAVAESSWTLPTHASLLTGVTMGVHGLAAQGRKHIPADLPLLAELLAEQGFATHGVWSGAYLHPVFGFGRGFPHDGYIGIGGRTMFDAEGDAEGVAEDVADAEAGGHGLVDERAQVNGLGAADAAARARRDKQALAVEAHRTVTSPEVVDEAIAFLERQGEAPFFAFLHLFDIHYDFQPPEADWRRFDPDYAGDMTGVDFITDKAIHAGMDPADLEHLLARYDGEIRFTDRHLGRLLDAVDALGLAGDTLIVVTADHGDEFFEHGKKGHRKTLYEEVLHVPLIARGPGIAPGTRLPDVVRHIDVMPTILELLDVPVPEHVMGRSVAPQLRAGGRGGAASAGGPLGISRLMKPRYQVAVRGRSWKVICDLSGEEVSARLFDLEADPGEQAPLEGEEAQATIERALEHIEQLNRDEQTLRARFAEGDQDASLPEALEQQLRELGYIR